MNDMYEEIKQILLQHKGKARAIKSKNISSRIGLPMEDTQKISRLAIWHTAEKYGLPLVACKNGYFIAETDDEIAEYEEHDEWVEKKMTVADYLSYSLSPIICFDAVKAKHVDTATSGRIKNFLFIRLPLYAILEIPYIIDYLGNRFP